MTDTPDTTLWNPDLAPTRGPSSGTWLWYHYAALVGRP